MHHAVHAQHLPSGSSVEACSGGGEGGGQTAPGVGNNTIMISTVYSECITASDTFKYSGIPVMTWDPWVAVPEVTASEEETIVPAIGTNKSV